MHGEVAAQTSGPLAPDMRPVVKRQTYQNEGLVSMRSRED